MKKKIMAAVLVAVMMIAGCGASEPKVIGGNGGAASTAVSAKSETSASSDESATSTESAGEAEANERFVFTTDAGVLDVDMPIDDALAILGDNYTKFEAKSCAFDGMTEFYTYGNCELDTYTDSEGTKLCTVALLNDLVSTTEGVSIGDTAEKLDEVYGKDYEGDISSRTYEKGGVTLTFIMTSGKVISIEYRSTAFK